MDHFRAAGLELQELGARDLPRIQDLLERCAEWWALIHGRAPRDDEAEWLLQDLPPRFDRRRLIGVAAGGGALAGLVDATDGWPQRGITWIGLMLFEPASRSRGLGAALLAELERELRGAGTRAVQLMVQAQNPRARAFWERMGFSPMASARVRAGRLVNDVTVLRRDLAVPTVDGQPRGRGAA
ncbi:GCN5-related N-acetyltransferase [Anaeromyxobacter dehalogenans 2CP-1]|uniref:GCN5-related N-acetyltransferase n=1 Tax=Anaeromyxobacter dehalogenans (strain ATCC BAA-258 / DSM 21875 / 2CP-1) TaxID=455488 RepID=B8J615_ANAD2|nr:GNAT family N-acetyltransferase [Anaeromyxobacter dehalogenans]ACL66910.1 GCN5-related N-acetyltransferase [Anaeromyxobacter dehalogenans 2CP-1]